MTIDTAQHVPAPDEIVKTLSMHADVSSTDLTPKPWPTLGPTDAKVVAFAATEVGDDLRRISLVRSL